MEKMAGQTPIVFSICCCTGKFAPSPDGCVADPCCVDASIKFKGDAGNDGLGEWWMQFSGEAAAVAHTAR